MSADLTFTAAMVQMRTGLLPEPSLEQGTRLIREAGRARRRLRAHPRGQQHDAAEPQGAVRASRARRGRSLAEGLSRAGGGAEDPPPYRLAGAALLAGEGRQPLVPDRTGRHADRELRQDPHVRHRPARRRELSRIRQLPAGRNRRDLRPAVGPDRADDLLRRALSGALSRARRERRVVPHRALRLHPQDRRGALAHAAARPRHRERLFRVRRRAGRTAREQARDLWPFADRRSLGRRARRRRRRARRLPGEDRSRKGRDRAQDACRRCSTAGASASPIPRPVRSICTSCGDRHDPLRPALRTRPRVRELVPELVGL